VIYQGGTKWEATVQGTAPLAPKYQSVSKYPSISAAADEQLVAHVPIASNAMGRGSLSCGDVGAEVFFFFVHSYSHSTYIDHGGVHFAQFPVRSPLSGGTLQALLCPPPRPVPKRKMRTKDTTKESTKET